ncbi:ribokinase [Branchiibius hedensis]|uniref:Ribokinase n=1 Tax=Branchiibius hedensis TaxID=672460 RepID=A0A2Y8ZSR2_9MICO|nr:ribokinase [Branchiibius hedensis]PWJ26192.1 ribokinase [Branchiibius hedensis]SSA35004.1 ribokinase [Branchiibius hedensis]
MTVYVLGALNVDLVTRVPHHPAPGETIMGRSAGRFAGGKGGNQAMAAARAGVEVVMVGCVGDDDLGTAYLARLTDAGLRTQIARAGDQPTGTALITVSDDGENSIIVIPGANESASAPSGLTASDVLLCSLEVSLEVVASAARAAHAAGARVVLNLAPYADLPADVIALADPVVVNETEAGQLQDAGLRPVSVVTTLGSQGATWTRGSGEVAREAGIGVRRVVDSTGAGDTFCGALAAALARGLDDAAALREANAAGAQAVSWQGAQPDGSL